MPALASCVGRLHHEIRPHALEKTPYKESARKSRIPRPLAASLGEMMATNSESDRALRHFPAHQLVCSRCLIQPSRLLRLEKTNLLLLHLDESLEHGNVAPVLGDRLFRGPGGGFDLPFSEASDFLSKRGGDIGHGSDPLYALN